MERMYNNVPEATIQNGSDIVTHVYNYASYLGWEVVDSSISGVSGDYVVIKSEGGTKNNNRLPCYLKVYTNNTTYVNWNLYVHWDSDTHTFAGALCYSNPSTSHAYVLGVQLDSNNDNVFHFRGNKDFILFTNFKRSTSITYRSIVLRIDNPFWDISGFIQNSAPGDLATVTLADGEVDQFEIGGTYRMVSSDGYIDRATVSSKDTINNQMSITGHTYPTSSGTCIGTHPFPWVGLGNANDSYNYNPIALLNNVTNHYSTTYAFTASYPISMQHGMVNGVSSQQDYFNHGKVSLWPYVFYEGTYGVWGHSSYLQYFSYGSVWDKLAVNVQDTGVVSEATATTITGLNKNWIEDVLINMTLIITSGDQEEEARVITANTSDQITFDPAISPTVSGAETFTICEGVFTRYPQISGKSYIGIREV